IGGGADWWRRRLVEAQIGGGADWWKRRWVEAQFGGSAGWWKPRTLVRGSSASALRERIAINCFCALALANFPPTPSHPFRGRPLCFGGTRLVEAQVGVSPG